MVERLFLSYSISYFVDNAGDIARSTSSTTYWQPRSASFPENQLLLIICFFLAKKQLDIINIPSIPGRLDMTLYVLCGSFVSSISPQNIVHETLENVVQVLAFVHAFN